MRGNADAPNHTLLVERLRERIYRECDAADILVGGASAAADRIRKLSQEFLAEERIVLPSSSRAAVLDQVVAATTGFGPLQEPLNDPTVSEIMVNGPGKVFIERNGKIEQSNIVFADDEHVRQVIDRILAPIGRRIDSHSPMVDARLPDGSRVNAVIPPLSIDGPTLTIRRFLRVARTLDDLEALGSCSSEQRDELEQLIVERANVVVAGPTSSGKTTLLSAALARCEPTDRVIVIEDSAELPVELPHRVRLEARPATWEVGGEVRIRDLVRNALRMRPDRLVIGEVRGEEAFDLIQALNTGHRGCWSTVHANGSEDALFRIESMAMYAGTGVPHDVVRIQISRAIDAIVFVQRDSDGVRRIGSIDRVSEQRNGWMLSQRSGQ
jgi:pilus assembly protein CpaF